MSYDFKQKKNNTPFYLVAAIISYLFVFVFSCHAGSYKYEHPRSSLFEQVAGGLGKMTENPIGILPIRGETLGILIMVSVIFLCIVGWMYYDMKRNEHHASGKESGSAEWNKDLNKYNKQYTDPPNKATNDGEKNLILSNDVFLNMDTRKTLRNNNIAVVGGSGSGKSRFFVKPNLLQANCSYVVTDPSGELFETTGNFFRKQGYKVKLFNLVDMKYGDCYNPFDYIRDDLGVLTMINCLIQNTTPTGASKGDPFWEKSETALLQALAFYLIKERNDDEKNFSSIMKLLRIAEVDENNPNAKSTLDKLFDSVEAKDPGSLAVKMYKTFKMGGGKTLKSILISTSVRLQSFDLEAVENLTSRDTLDLGSIGSEKQILYVVIPVADKTYNFLVSMMYSQLFETLYYKAETEYTGKRLPVHVRFLLDEFANIGQIPEFAEKLATMRKYEISCSIILQNLAQLKKMYKDDWGGILGNCDSFLFLGGQEMETLEHVSKALGKATIIVKNNSRSKGSKGGSNDNFGRSARELMTPDELMKMDNGDCITIIRGLLPFIGKKYDYPKHKNYIHTGDSDESKTLSYKKEFNNSRVANKAAVKASQIISLDIKKSVLEKDDKYISSPKPISELGKTIGVKDVKKFNEAIITGNVKVPENKDDVEIWGFDTIEM